MNYSRLTATTGLVLLSGWLAWSAPLSAATSTVEATAQYQSVVNGPTTVTHGDPGNATATAAAGPGGIAFPIDEGVEIYDDAHAKARSNLPGSIGSYSHAGGYSPSFAAPPTLVQASASVNQITEWIAHSDPSITTAQITLAVFYDGSLLAASYGGASQIGEVYATVATSLSTSSSLGNVAWFDATATLDRFGGLTTGGPWGASFANATVSPSSVSYVTADYFEVFSALMTVPTNEVWSFESLISTNAFVKGAFENWAISDFFASGGFELAVASPGVTLEHLTAAPVPLPPAVYLFGVALFGLIARRRGPA